MEFKDYLNAIGQDSSTVNNIDSIVNALKSNRKQISNDYFVQGSASIKEKETMLHALRLLVGYQNYLAFKEYSQPRHSYPLALLYASKLYKTVAMMAEDSIFEINEENKIEHLYQHARAHQQTAGGIYHVSNIESYGSNRYYSAALKQYKKYLGQR